MFCGVSSRRSFFDGGKRADEERAIFGDAAFGANLSGMLAECAIGSDTNFDIDVVRIGRPSLSSTSKPGS
jgi:hypothetical protein